MDESLVVVPEWQKITWLRHGFGTRRGGVSTVYGRRGEADGDLNAGWTSADDPASVAENRRRLLAAAGADIANGRLITVRQVHSAVSIVVARDTDPFPAEDGRALAEADGLITDAVGPVLGIQTADCVPVLVVDRGRRAVAAFHAGWRGTVASIVEKGVTQIVEKFGSRRADLLAAVGPSIGTCCYSVGDEVWEKFDESFEYARDLFDRRSDAATQKLYVDLKEANRRQLLTAGLKPENITVIPDCSGCTGLPGRRKYFSHRGENGFTGRMMSMIAIAPE